MSFALILTVITLIGNFMLLKYPKGRFKYTFTTPIVFTSMFIILYMILGFKAFWKEDFYFLGNNLSNSLPRVYSVSSLFVICLLFFFLFFYYFFKKDDFSPIREDYLLKAKYVYLFVVSVSAYSILSINGIIIPIFNNFFGLLFNAGITIISYAVITKMRGSYLLLIFMAILISYLGFRYRLIFLFLPILISFFVFKDLNFLKMFKYSFITFISVVTIGVVGVSRRYSQGLQFEFLYGLDLTDIIIGGIFNDTSTVLTSGALIQRLDESNGYAYFKQIWYIINYFIPSELYPNKVYSPIYDNISIVTAQKNNESGAAVLGFAEYYHTAGYLGVIIFAFIFGLFFARSFKKMISSSSVFEHYVYFSLLTWFVNSLTRGYFPQNAQELLSILIGLYLIKRFSNLSNAGVYVKNSYKRV